MSAVEDLATLAVGIVAVVVSGFFLLADDPSLQDLGTVVVPIALLVAGAACLVAGATGRASRPRR